MEKIFVIFVAILSSVLFGYVLSSIGQIFTQISEKRKEERNSLALINSFIKKRGLSKQLQFKVKKFFEYHFKTNYAQNQQCDKLMSQLTGELKKDVKIEIYKKMIMTSKLFNGVFSESFIRDLCSLISEQSYLPEQIIIHQGDRVENLQFLIKGEVEYYVQMNVKKDQTLKKITKHDTINGKAFFTQENSSYSARSRSFCIVAQVGYQDFLNLLKIHEVDKERYFEIKNQIVFKEKKSYQRCPVCQQLHDYKMCPYIFYIPNYKKLLKLDSLVETQGREEKQRQDRYDWNAISDRQLIYQVAVTLKEGYQSGMQQSESMVRNQRGLSEDFQNQEQQQQEEERQSSYGTQHSIKKTRKQKRENPPTFVSQQSRSFQKLNSTTFQIPIPKQFDTSDFEDKEKEKLKEKDENMKILKHLESKNFTKQLDVILYEYQNMVIKEDLPDIDHYHEFKAFYIHNNLSNVIHKAIKPKKTSKVIVRRSLKPKRKSRRFLNPLNEEQNPAQQMQGE